MSDGFKPSIDVHPLIRAGRWSFLIAGIIYGFNKRILYSHIESKAREERLRRKAERDAELAEERRKQSEKDLEELGRMCIPESYPPQCPPGTVRRPDSDSNDSESVKTTEGDEPEIVKSKEPEDRC
ncbi:uncharacterized protein [Onthophagus taurus]|uniref:uncharacterized protein n=1 Tax=Onthophagus taurus TaxID=166361 RepID=UPI0039BE2E10